MMMSVCVCVSVMFMSVCVSIVTEVKVSDCHECYEWVCVCECCNCFEFYECYEFVGYKFVCAMSVVHVMSEYFSGMSFMILCKF